jgi:hypothetical protein
LEAADEAVSGKPSNVGFRPVTPLAYATLPPGEKANSPHWMQLRIADDTPRVDADDFRDELKLSGYPGNRLSWSISVAPNTTGGDKSGAAWQRIGMIVLNRDAVSGGCDAKLHFAHPQLSK